ncbi:uncharacterized protein G2W53_043567 [Senna tora]|uniref:Uncharacterized protein n=1 Tax=Senna tora TaxID=362788 RepID=A0A834W3I8_9FABA|nr:uncharacterized protein G2W53_043567 [Senna tora]
MGCSGSAGVAVSDDLDSSATASVGCFAGTEEAETATMVSSMASTVFAPSSSTAEGGAGEGDFLQRPPLVLSLPLPRFRLFWELCGESNGGGGGDEGDIDEGRRGWDGEKRGSNLAVKNKKSRKEVDVID